VKGIAEYRNACKLFMDRKFYKQGHFSKYTVQEQDKDNPE